jgi:hypothetical protein
MTWRNSNATYVICIRDLFVSNPGWDISYSDGEYSWLYSDLQTNAEKIPRLSQDRYLLIVSN